MSCVYSCSLFVAEIHPSLRAEKLLFDEPTLERILPSKSSRIEPLNRGRSAELPLGANPLCLDTPSRSSALRFVGRVGYCQFSLREMAGEYSVSLRDCRRFASPGSQSVPCFKRPSMGAKSSVRIGEPDQGAGTSVRKAPARRVKVGRLKRCRCTSQTARCCARLALYLSLDLAAMNTTFCESPAGNRYTSGNTVLSVRCMAPRRLAR